MDTTWLSEQDNNIPYVVTSDISVYDTYDGKNPTLSIAPGTIIKFNNGCGICIAGSDGYGVHKGALVARGTQNSPIIFTSSSSTPSEGSWKNICFNPATDISKTILEYCTVEYGGNEKGGIYCNQTSPLIKNCTIRKSIYGIYLDNSSDLIENCTFSENSSAGACGSGNATFKGCTFSANGYGLKLISPYSYKLVAYNLTLTDNAFTNNASFAISMIPTVSLSMSGNAFSANGQNAIEIPGGRISVDATWLSEQDNNIPYVVTSDISIYDPYEGNAPTLTIAPGTIIKFNNGCGLFVSGVDGNGPHPGALIAQGTQVKPILFTSSSATPARGNWRDIYFHAGTVNSKTIMEFCTIEYGGGSDNSSIYCYQSSPLIQHNTIRYSSGNAIIANGSSCRGLIQKNNIRNNGYGITLLNNAQPEIHNNNLIQNTNYGIYNQSSVSVNAENNWWGDPRGPNFYGDKTNGNIDFDPWLLSEADISGNPTNFPPVAPSSPSPALNAVRVPLTDGKVSLSWSCSDLNAFSVLSYDVYFGEDQSNLLRYARNISTCSFTKEGLESGKTYFWKIVANDDGGLSTPGPIWSFTTAGSSPDLVISDISWTPATLHGGDNVTFTATITNNGQGPLVDPINIDFKINGTSIGSVSFNQVLTTGKSAQVTKTWTAVSSPNVTAVADSSNQVAESDESNNSFSKNLPEIADKTPPDLVSSTPQANASVSQLSNITFKLSDRDGTVDDVFVIASVVLKNSQNQAISGTTAESNDLFTFTPSQSLPDSTYTLSFTARDNHGNQKDYSVTFTLDTAKPAVPAITGGTLNTGVIKARPFANKSNTSAITLQGTRDDGCTIYVNGTLMVAAGTGNWSANVNLNQGDNSLTIYASDNAGNQSDSIWADVYVDSIAPGISSVSPVNQDYLAAAPSSITVNFTETGSLINQAQSLRMLKNATLAQVQGSWSFTGNQLTFTPASTLPDGVYTLDVQLEDNLGNKSSPWHSQFTVDTVAPAAPVLNAVTTPTHRAVQTISGVKEAGTGIKMNGSLIIPANAQTTWQTQVSLAAGSNLFHFTCVDYAGNTSPDTTVEIVFSDTPPQAVNTLRVTSSTEGTSAILNWQGYDESLESDILKYQVFVETSSFNNVSSLTPKAEPLAGTFTFTASGLQKGSTYWAAVVAVDKAGQRNVNVTPVSITLSDTTPPENPSSFSVQSQDTSFVLKWTPSQNTSGDLAGYKVYQDGALIASPASGAVSSEVTGLLSAHSYLFKITAVDSTGNESSGVQIQGVTLLQNPANLTVKPSSGYATLSWNAVSPAELVKSYAVYMSETDFTSVEDMTPVQTVAATTAGVAGLKSGVTYYFAVSAVNLSGGERKSVVAVSATPAQDTEGPEISDVLWNDTPLTPNMTLSQSGSVYLTATDEVGISRVEFYLDGVLFARNTTGSSSYSGYLDIQGKTEGTHTLTLKAFDSLGNQSSTDFTVQIAKAVPAAPVLTSPANNFMTNRPSLTVEGTAEPFSTIQLNDNGTVSASTATASVSGRFSVQFTLSEGVNQIRAKAVNSKGEGPESAALKVNLDTSIPFEPVQVNAVPKSGGVVHITWMKPVEESSITGYNIYRSDAPFFTLAEAEKINSSVITSSFYDDLAPQEKTYYYGITLVDLAGNESKISKTAAAIPDNTSPKAVTIDYVPKGEYDSASGRIGVGVVNVLVKVSEPLQTVPYLSLTPSGGVPITVSLAKQSDTEYQGTFVITDATSTGTAYAVFSARDIAGNRGTEILDGASIQIDAKGPDVISLEVTPASPIRNDSSNPAVLAVRAGLNEKIKPGTSLAFFYKLSGSGRVEAPTGGMGEVTPKPGEAQAFQGTLTLPADAGQNGAESLAFGFTASDDLDNTNGKIYCSNSFEIYQGTLPPLSIPGNFRIKALSGGRIELDWDAVAGASGYQIYRTSLNGGDYTPLVKLGAVTQYIDTPPSEGTWYYKMASIRTQGAEESLSPLTAAKFTASDGTVPASPVNLTLELTPIGIKIAWNPGPFTETVTYNLYRANAAEITTVAGLTPLVTGLTQTSLIDPTPSNTDKCYAITAVDTSGNESLPSNSAYLNTGLLPVNSLRIIQDGISLPEVLWTHPSANSIAGYNLFAGAKESLKKVNTSLLPVQSWTDTGYNGTERSYAISAVDANGYESLKRTVTLPQMSAVLLNGIDPSTLSVILSEGTNASGTDIATVLEKSLLPRRGLMNRLNYLVYLPSSNKEAVTTARLSINLNQHAHTSEPFSINPGEYKIVPVIVGGYADLPVTADTKEKIRLEPNEGESVDIIRYGQVEVKEGMLGLRIETEEFTRGVSGKARFTLENTGDEEIEIVTATNGGQSPSDEVTFNLLDSDGNILSSVPLKQTISSSVSSVATILTLPSGKTVVRIPAGATWTSDNMTLSVPSNAPSNVTIKAILGAIRYHTGRDDQVVMQGLSSTQAVVLADTAYYGEITSITPLESFNTNDGKDITTGIPEITIKGKAVTRKDGSSLASAPLKLIISVKGFERTFDVITGEDGTFTQSFKPLGGESGIYTVYLVHPALLDRKPQGTFTVKRAVISPAGFNVKAPRNYKQDLSIALSTCDGVELNNVKLSYDPADQDSQLPVILSEVKNPSSSSSGGLYLTLPTAITKVSANQTATLPFSIRADNKAPASGTLKLRVTCNESASYHFALTPLNFNFSEAKPVLNFTPNFLETGMGRNDHVQEVITLENNGLSEMCDLQLTLVNKDGTPAPAWVQIASENYLESLAVGGKTPVTIAFSPGANVAIATHELLLRVNASNYPQTDIGIYATVAESGQGGVSFQCEDIYTTKPDPVTNKITHGVTGATIQLQNEALDNIQFKGTTDDSGYYQFSNVPAGNYKVRINANEHQTWIGRVIVKPGISNDQTVFLEYNLVTVEWEVKPITIQDKYEIILNTTFKTNVPAPVVVTEPGSVSLPDMHKGDVFNGEIKMTNHGLIQAQNMKMKMPTEDEFFKYELLSTVPEILKANESVTLCYKVTCLASPNLEDASGATGGGDCKRRAVQANIFYQSKADCDRIVDGSAQFNWLWEFGDCLHSRAVPTSPPVSYGGSLYADESYGGNAGGSVSESPSASTPISEDSKLCPPGSNCCTCDDCCTKDQEQPVASDVNVFTGKYIEKKTDLTFKIPGYTVEYVRKYSHKGPTNYGGYVAGDITYWNQIIRTDEFAIILPIPNSDMGVTAVLRNGYKTVLMADGTIKKDLSGTTSPSGQQLSELSPAVLTGAVIEYDKFGNWIKTNEHGQPVEFCNKNGIKIFSVFDSKGRLSGLKDNTGRQVLFLTYDGKPKAQPFVPSLTGPDGSSYVPSPFGYSNVLQVEDYSGRKCLYEYNSHNDMTKATNVMNEVYEYIYDSSTRLITKKMPDGSIVNISYNAYSYVSEVNYDKYKFMFTYRINRALGEYYSAVTTPGKTLIERWFDKYGNLTKSSIQGNVIKKKLVTEGARIEMDAAGNTITRNYDKDNNLTQITYADGSSIKYEYDPASNQLTKKINEKGIITLYENDVHGNCVKKTEAVGTGLERVSEYTLDNSGNVTIEKNVGKHGEPDLITTMEYNANGDMTKLTDPEGRVTNYTYNSLGNVLTREQNGKTWTYEYYPNGLLKNIKDPLGKTVQYSYDAQGKRTKVIDADNRETNYEYDLKSNLVRITDALGNSASAEYSLDDQLTSATDPESRKFGFEYDALKMTKIIDGNKNETSLEYDDVYNATCWYCTGTNRVSSVKFPTVTKDFRYDPRGRVIEEKDVIPAEAGIQALSTLYSYDSLGNLVSLQDKEGNKTGYEYDVLNHLTKVTDALSQESSRVYDTWGNLVSLKDEKGNETKFEYDKSGLLTKETRPMGQVTTYQYFSDGLLKTRVDAKGQKTEYEYYDNDQIKTVKYYESTIDVNPVKTVSFTYDNVGNLTTWDDGTVSGTMQYDEIHRKISESIDYGSFTLSYAYTYYKNGFKKTFTNADGITYTYQYDSNNLLNSVDIPGNGSITYGSYNWLRPTSIAYPGGTSRQMTYDPLLRLKGISVKDPSQTQVMNYQYGFDKVGNILIKSTEHGNYGFQYDKIYQLTNAQYPDSSVESFEYDPAGNRKSHTVANVTKPSTVNLNNELINDGNATYDFDSNGNQIKKTEGSKVLQYVYNVEDRVEKVKNEQGNVIATYYYDCFGRRLWKEVSGVRTYFFYSDEGLVAEADSTGAVIRTYGYAPNSIWTTNPLWVKCHSGQGGESSSYFFYQNDSLGTPQKILAQNGAVVWDAKYEAFGKATVMEQAPVENNLRFPGQYYDSETGTCYNWHRDYDPVIGRYTKVDPIGFSGEDLNFFRYVGNNSLNYFDSWGLMDFAPDFPGINLHPPVQDPVVTPPLRPTEFLPPQQFVTPINPDPFGGGIVDTHPGIEDDGPRYDTQDKEKEAKKCEKKPEKRHTPDQEALVEIAKDKEKRGGVSEEEAETLVQWGTEIGLENTRGPESHPNRPEGSKPHIHVGPVNHIPVNKN